MPRYIKGQQVRHLGNYTVANLPTNAKAGDTAFATNGRKASQTNGNGTGNLVFYDGSAWIRADTGAVADA